MPEFHSPQPEGIEDQAGPPSTEGAKQYAPRIPQSPDLELCSSVTQWMEFRESHLPDYPLLSAEERVKELQFERATFFRFIDFLWTNYAKDVWHRTIREYGERQQAVEPTLNELLFRAPRERINAFLESHGRDISGAERAHRVLYGQFYSWAHDRKLTTFNPGRFFGTLPYLHIQPGTSPENRVINRFLEYMASPTNALDLEGAGIDRKIAQQLARPVIRFADFLWDKELQEIAASGIDVSTLSAREKAERLETRIRTINFEILNEYLEATRAQSGDEARNRAASAIRRWFAPFLAAHFEGPAPERLEKPQNSFPEVQSPRTEFLDKYRAHLREVSSLPPDDPKHLNPGTAHNRDYVARRYIEFIWDKYGKKLEGDPSLNLDTLLRDFPYDRINDFMEHYADGDPKSNDAARVRYEKVNSGLRLMYQWARAAGLSTYDFDLPFGAFTWFRASLAPPTPHLPVFDNYCDFLGAEVELRRTTSAAGIEEGTAVNYRRHVAHFLAAAWKQYTGSEQHASPIERPSTEAFEADLKARGSEYASHYLAELANMGTPESVLKTIRSGVTGIFLPWMKGELVHVGRMRRSGSSQSPSTSASHSEERRKPRNQAPVTREAGEKPAMTQPLTGPPVPPPLIRAPLFASLPAAPTPAVAPSTAMPPESGSPQRRNSILEPRTAASIIRARNIAIDALIGRERGQGAVTFSELCQLRMNEYDEAKGLIFVRRSLANRQLLRLDDDCRAMLNDYVRQARNARPLLRACLAAGKEAPLFLSTDGKSLCVQNTEDAVDTPEALKPLYEARDSLITQLIRQTEFRFQDLVELSPPLESNERTGMMFFRGRQSTVVSVSLAANLARNIREYCALIMESKFRDHWESQEKRQFLFPACDGRKLTGDE